jgi:hypothetical protein
MLYLFGINAHLYFLYVREKQGIQSEKHILVVVNNQYFSFLVHFARKGSAIFINAQVRKRTQKV